MLVAFRSGAISREVQFSNMFAQHRPVRVLNAIKSLGTDERLEHPENMFA